MDRSRLGGSLLLRVDGVLGVRWMAEVDCRLHQPRSGITASRAAAVLRSGRGAAVLAQQSAQPGHHQHLSFAIAERGIAGRRPKVEATMGPSPVVVLDD